MKKILITGANSYVGTSLETWLKQWPDDYCVDTVSLLDDQWKEMSFCGYDAVFHVAGIAHIRETRENAPLYYREHPISSNKTKRIWPLHSKLQ